ncbi:MAG: DUF5989 family protein [Acidobacteriota bacterium]
MSISTPPSQDPEHQKSQAPANPGVEDSAFAQAAEEEQPSFLAELWAFLAESKKWWLTPILLVLLLMAALILLSSTGAAPFIYTLF